jgi:hypothetical protein
VSEWHTSVFPLHTRSFDTFTMPRGRSLYRYQGQV